MGLVNARRLGTPREVADRLQCGLSTVYRLIQHGTIPAVCIPNTRVVRVPMDRFETLLRRWENTGRRRRGQRGRNGGSHDAVGGDDDDGAVVTNSDK
jgi:excisionase family DNA binding protein